MINSMIILYDLALLDIDRPYFAPNWSIAATWHTNIYDPS